MRPTIFGVVVALVALAVYAWRGEGPPRDAASQRGETARDVVTGGPPATTRQPRDDAPAEATASRSEHGIVRVGGWNIEWLGLPEERSGPAGGVAQSVEDLVDYLQAARVDVLALSEIARDEAGGRWTSPILDVALAELSRRTSGRWRHELYPVRTGRNQLVGLAWNEARVQAYGDKAFTAADPDERGPGGGRLWSRPAYGRLFRAGPGLTDFAVIVVHMKSDFDGDQSAHRAAEGKALLETLPKAVTDADIVIIGDVNTASVGEPLIQIMREAGFHDVNRRDQSTHWRYGALDRAFVPQDQPEFRRRSFEVLRDSYLSSRRLDDRAFKQRLSDHFMIITEVDVGPDDD